MAEQSETSKSEASQADANSQVEPVSTSLDFPIDSMLLIHKPLKCEAARVEEMVRLLEEGDSLQPVRAAFNLWASALTFHALQEDEHMTAHMPDYEPARVNEAEHSALDPILNDITSKLDQDDKRGLADRVKDLAAALHEEQHLQLFDRLEEVMEVLNEEIGRTKVVARAHRHLYQSMVALRVAQDDHLECEEEFVLPQIREDFQPSDQLSMIRSLLIDDLAADKRWVLDWVAGHLDRGELEYMVGLEKMLDTVSSSAD